MTIFEYLKVTTAALQSAGIESARLDALVLLEDTLKQNRALLLAHPEAEIPAPIAAELYKKRVQRESHVPLAYIRGKVMFYGREFAVNHDVLVPRPESEAIIETLKKLALPAKPHIADIGTGSGCLGITAALEIAGSLVDLYDISAAALACAKHNAQQILGAQTHVYKEDLLERALPRKYDVILANLPYVPNEYPVNRAATHEPKLALFAGDDGLELYRRFWLQLELAAKKDKDTRPAHIITEALPSQHKALATLAKPAGYKLAATDDFMQHFATS